MQQSNLSFLQQSTLWLLIAASFSINLPVGFGSVTLGLFLILWAVSGAYKTKFALVANNPGALVALAFLGLYALGTTYSSASWHDALHYLLKYAKFIVIPLAVGALLSDRYRQYALNAFLISLILYLVVSYLNWFGLVPLRYIHHGTYLAFGFYMMLRNARKTAGHHRTTWIILAALTLFDLIFITDVRTGVVTSFVLFLIFAVETWGLKGLMYLGGLLLITLVLFKLVPGAAHSRLYGMHAEVQSNATSAGIRAEMYTNTLKLIKTHPVFGGGTGSLQGEYTKLIADDPHVIARRITNCHNQYLMTAHELGVVGLLLLLAFWGVHWWQSYQLTQVEHGHLLRALIVNTSVGSLLNSLLLDSGDGRMYCILAGVLLSGYLHKPGSLKAD